MSSGSTARPRGSRGITDDFEWKQDILRLQKKSLQLKTAKDAKEKNLPQITRISRSFVALADRANS
jgi:hypothetical protein